MARAREMNRKVPVTGVTHISHGLCCTACCLEVQGYGFRRVLCKRPCQGGIQTMTHYLEHPRELELRPCPKIISDRYSDPYFITWVSCCG